MTRPLPVLLDSGRETGSTVQLDNYQTWYLESQQGQLDYTTYSREGASVPLICCPAAPWCKE